MNRHAHQIDVAVKQGTSTSSKTNTSVNYEPPYVRLLTLRGPGLFPLRGERVLLGLDGPQRLMRGVLKFWHWDACVLTVDFDRKMITDDGFEGYSLTTGRNVKAWAWDVQYRWRLPLPPWWMQWTNSWRRRRFVSRHKSWTSTEQEPDGAFDRFRNGVPWVSKEANASGPPTLWFHWDRYDDKLADVYWRSRDHLRANCNKRYIEYRWDDQMRWTSRFIDADAERRWRARERRNGRPWRPT